jgi:glycosyltransferase involved in cell wall biosynthesis
VSMNPPVMTLILAAGIPDGGLRRRVEALTYSIAHEVTEVIVVCEAPWADPPPGVRVVVSNSGSRGDKLDRASEEARGEVLAFLDDGSRLIDGWQERALEILRDPTVGAAGGPHIVAHGATARQRAVHLILGSWFGSGPLWYRFRAGSARLVCELPTTNLVVRKSAFVAVGGFQSPTPLGDDTRLCYKLRSLLGLRVVYDPGLAVESPPNALRQPLLPLAFRWGQQRGDLSRRLPQISKPIPYSLPAAGLLPTLAVLALSPFTVVGRTGAAVLAATYFMAGIWLVLSGRQLRAGILAAAGLPMTHLAYAAGFWKGYLGRNMGEISHPAPPRRGPRILICNWRDITHPWAGGAELYMHQIGRRWVQAGFEVGWLSQRYRAGKRVEVIDGIRFHRVGGRFTLYPFAALAYLLRLRNRYDVIVDCENGIPYFTPLYSRKPVTLVVFHLHSDVFRRELPRWVRWLAVWLESWLMPHVYSNQPIVTISASTQADLENRGYARSRILQVVPGVDLSAGRARAPESGSPLLLYLGRLKAYKSVDVLLRAMPDVLSRYPNTRLAIVGQGPEREGLERLTWGLKLAASVRFYGYLDRTLRDDLLAQAWLAICPSAFEGWGVVCLEANAWRVPVVAARVSGLRDAVLDGVTGVLVPHGDPKQLAEEIIGLIADPVRRAAMGEAGRAWAAEHQWQRSADKFLQAVGQVLPVPATGDRIPQMGVVTG